MRQRGAIASADKFVAGGVDPEKLRSRGDELQRRGHLVKGAEAVASAVNEQRGGAQAWEVRGAELRRFLRADAAGRRAKGARRLDRVRRRRGSRSGVRRRNGRRERCGPEPVRGLVRPRGAGPAGRVRLRRVGGPCGRSCRKGKSQRRTATPASENACANATSSGVLQLDPAPCVRTSASPEAFAGACRYPRTGTFPAGASSTG